MGINKFLSNTDIDNCMTFIQTVLYGGNINEAYIETRINIYDNQRTKSSMTLPPDPNSATRVIFRAHNHCYYWVRCLRETILSAPFQDYGWFFDCQSDFIRSVWFKGEQLPPLLATKSGSRKRKKVDDYVGDVEDKYNVKKSKTIKSCKVLLQKRKTYNKNQEKSNFRFTDKNYNIDSYSYGDETDSEIDDWERFSDFEDSELISDSSDDDWIPEVVIITAIWMLFGIYKIK